MEPMLESSASDPLDHALIAVPAGDPKLDVPGLLASRIGDLYASEELRDRQERADRILRKASQD